MPSELTIPKPEPICTVPEVPELLVEDGFLRPEDISSPPAFSSNRVDVAAVSAFKMGLLKKAHDNFLREGGEKTWDGFRDFLVANAGWLQDFALFSALKERFSGASWLSWPPEFRDRRLRSASGGAKALGEAVSRQEFFQYLFDSQWRRLRRKAAEIGLEIMGDIPLYVSLESADVWSHRHVFRLGGDGRPSVVSGVPPDAFSATGQLWGTPVYDWRALQKTAYSWWLERFERAERLFDWARLDHFIGYERYWEIVAGAAAATGGSWCDGPGADFLAAVLARIKRLRLVAENLGVVTPEVEALRKRFGLPGTRVVPFDLEAPADELPPYPDDTVLMTSTHDTPTLGTWIKEGTGIAGADPDQRWTIIDRTLHSAALLTIFSVQDILGLGDEARINRPGVAHGNWTWRLPSQSLDEKNLRRLGELTEKAGRSPSAAPPSVPRPQGEPPSAASFSLFTENDLHLFNEGTHYRIYRQMGAHPADLGGVSGTYFAVWAPDAENVCVAGDFNGWSEKIAPLKSRGVSGIWEGFIPEAKVGQSYKYVIYPRRGGLPLFKADPLAFFSEEPPKSASRIWDLGYDWGDATWMRRRGAAAALDAPISIYEAHLGSWMRTGKDGHRARYRDLAFKLRDHVLKNGFTHVEILPLMEHPFYGSWGYQVTGYFAPTARYGTPQDLMFLIDTLHQAGLGVILDWPCSHFATDGHGLGLFDGTHLYEHADPRQGFHPDWKSFIFNYGRNEVKNFLISNALFWLDRYHADGLRVDAVASMIYLDYSRQEGEWIPNRHGGRENLEALDFMRRLNTEVYRNFPDTQTIAEESTAWPMVSRPVSLGGLGFGFKWDMGWMHDTLSYLAKDPVHRKHHQDDITFRMLYAYHENFVLPLSHDEVVHGKGSLLSKMPGDDWQKFANLRLLYGWLYGQPGKKLLFMGAEMGARREWNHEETVEWPLLSLAPHAGIESWVRDLNRLYRTEPSLHRRDARPEGFEWIDCSDRDRSVLSFLRQDGGGQSPPVLAVFNFTPVPRMGYRVGAPTGGRWTELLNSDAKIYGGSGIGNLGEVGAKDEPHHGRPHTLSLALPPLACLFLKPIL